MFFPSQGSMALSETFLNLVPLSTPLQWTGASAVLTYNILFLLSFPTAALAAHALGRWLTGRHDAALIAGLAFGFAPYRAAQMPHLQMLWSCWMPLGLLALHGYLANRKARHLWLFGLCWLMNGLATGYYLFFFSVLVGLWLLWFARTLRDWVAIGVAAAIASLPIVPLLVGTSTIRRRSGWRAAYRKSSSSARISRRSGPQRRTCGRIGGRSSPALKGSCIPVPRSWPSRSWERWSRGGAQGPPGDIGCSRSWP